ncbi:hypothetical protein ICN46_06565 [Polynucleobacter sp. Latsch14-2]|jgi:hypothetical protein|uniref:hypothetical protein n=1 Tax=Polynucleobacter sp. Latsch14-2 TaxID=2576920 RepID=UPI001BFEC780|nr:hypothetical protein [Polynucleobacter sp. Latsch14-2]MBT8573829.1 hypothetical protein [Polynucleobacter paneuropaeus]MBT8606762.1 hypothetical protein [Polynucleobacter paneuropaeus]MBU3614552.1 hypothetical protein [Polynucleobacter sp. Latsch14-2]
MALNTKDNFFLFTLIDFLLQIIFVGLFVFFMTMQNPEKGLPTELIQKIKQAGVQEVAELIETANKLVPLDRLKELVELLKQFKNIDELKDALAVIRKLEPEGVKDILDTPKDKLKQWLGNLRGSPPCFKNESGGAKAIFTIAGYDSYYKIYGITDSGKEVFKVTGITFQDNQEIKPQELRDFGAKSKQVYKNCSNYVVYDAMVDRHSVFNDVRAWFVPSTGKIGYKK